MASLLSRRAISKLLLLKPNTSSSHLRTLLSSSTTISPSPHLPTTTTSASILTSCLSNPFLTPKPQRQNHPLSIPRAYCCTPHPPPPEKPTTQSPKHIDVSASEESEVAKLVVRLRKAASDLSWALIALGAAQCSHWTRRSVDPSEAMSASELMASVPAAVTVAFPCALAFLGWQLARNLRLLEGTAAAQGKVGPLGVAFQASGMIERLLLRARVVGLLCVVGVCFEPLVSHFIK